jgi:hypothetical protein
VFSAVHTGDKNLCKAQFKEEKKKLSCVTKRENYEGREKGRKD